MRRFLFLFLAAASPAAAQTPHLEESTISGHGATILIHRLPINTPNGIVLRDVTITLQSDAAGNVTVASRTLADPAVAFKPTAVPGIVSRPSAPLVVQKFLEGTYKSNSDGTLLNIVNLGIPLGHDTPRYSLTAIGTAGAVAAATWDAGPLETNPLRNRVGRAGIDPANFSFGTSDGGGADLFDTGALLGFAQSGTTLTIVSYRHGCCSDHAMPTGQIRYTRIAD